MLVLCVLIILTLTTTRQRLLQDKLLDLQEHLAEEQSDLQCQLNDGLWSWKGICHGWFQLAIGLLGVAILQGIQLRLLQSNAGLCQYSGLDMNSQDMFSQGSKVRRQLVTFCHIVAEEKPSQFRDGIDVDVLGGVGCTDKASQIDQHSVSHFCLHLTSEVKASADNRLHFYLPSCTLASRLLCLYEDIFQCCWRQ